LDTHIADVSAVLEWHDLKNVVLVGHSYGGMVITGVAEQSADRIGRLVYLDAFVPENGKCLMDYLPPEFGPILQEALSRGPERDGKTAPDPAAFGVLDPTDAAWVRAHIVPHPDNTFDMPLSLPNHHAASLPRSYVYCDDPAMGPFGQFSDRYGNEVGWQYHILHTGHDAMVSDPEGVMRVLIEDADKP
jgi:pimeloyl-ACP methyl ester carboxylesterase